MFVFKFFYSPFSYSCFLIHVVSNSKIDMDRDMDIVTDTDTKMGTDIQRFRYRISVKKCNPISDIMSLFYNMCIVH